VVAQGTTLHEAVLKLVTADQREAADSRGKATFDWLAQKSINIPTSLQSKISGVTPWTSLDVLNWMTIIGLIAIGLCLIAGFLTPVAALAAAGFLAMIYLSMPPWPGTPPNPRAEGHYMIVSKTCRAAACLVIATTPNGHWVGFDAPLFRRAAAATAGAQPRPRGN